MVFSIWGFNRWFSDSTMSRAERALLTALLSYVSYVKVPLPSKTIAEYTSGKHLKDIDNDTYAQLFCIVPSVWHPITS
jgi:hypothetical protein